MALIAEYAQAVAGCNDSLLMEIDVKMAALSLELEKPVSFRIHAADLLSLYDAPALSFGCCLF